jgi:hypothetical protein
MLRDFVDELPAELVTREDKRKFKNYMEKHWFGNKCPWRQAACRIRLFAAEATAALSSLNSTNNVTERLFRAIQEAPLGNFLNKKVSMFLMLTLNNLLPKHRDVVSTGPGLRVSMRLLAGS